MFWSLHEMAQIMLPSWHPVQRGLLDLSFTVVWVLERLASTVIMHHSGKSCVIDYHMNIHGQRLETR